MKVLLCGACGKMGREVRRLIDERDDITLAAAVDIAGDGADIPIFSDIFRVTCESDVILDFSAPSAAVGVCSYAKSKKLPLVMATTGHNAEQTAKIYDAANYVPVFLSANMSRGAVLLCELAEIASKNLPNSDIGVVETHRKNKLDSPSGTALALARSTGRDDVSIRSLRLGETLGEHEIIFCTEREELRISHRVLSRRTFAMGALDAARAVIGRKAGLYGMSILYREGK